MVLTCVNVECKTRVITLAAGVLMEEFDRLVAFNVSMSIKIIGHPSLASDLYVKMSQVIQEIDMLSQFVKRKMR